MTLEEQHDRISLGSLSQALIGLSQQAASFRKDATGKDFLHQFYEDHATQASFGAKYDKQKQEPGANSTNIYHHFDTFNVRMKLDYLRAFFTFETESSNMVSRLLNLIKSSSNDLEG